MQFPLYETHLNNKEEAKQHTGIHLRVKHITSTYSNTYQLHPAEQAERQLSFYCGQRARPADAERNPTLW